MTKSAKLSLWGAAHLERLLAQAGIESMHGIEMLHLVRMVAGAYDRMLNDVMRRQSLSPPRWGILLRLWVEEQVSGEALNPTHLSHSQRVAKNTISDHLRALEEDGLIERTLDPNDRRQFKIHLTEAGRSLVKQATPVHARLLNETLAAFSTEEIVQLQQLLSRLYDSLCTQIGENGCPSTSSASIQTHLQKEDM
ncbi:MAG: MarR family transcriptional regulator [Caldilinea sp.]|nr:MarR family transcriptional regulator [Caldilinea sp.]MDW8439911.1 MarR family transcriptional regulator [Caldilineaceae bacterium]